MLAVHVLIRFNTAFTDTRELGDARLLWALRYAGAADSCMKKAAHTQASEHSFTGARLPGMLKGADA